MNKQKINIPETPGVSLVSYYGNKPNQLIALIEKIQNYLSNMNGFELYKIVQIHSTIIGCEGLKTAEGIVNKWFYSRRNELRYLDCSGWLEYLQKNSYFPLNIYFGGYKLEQNYRFLSRNQHPYYRSFQLQQIDSKTYIPVLIGWDKQEDYISLKLDSLRRDAQRFNLLHKYHGEADSIDNDYYLRLGTINSELSPEMVMSIETEMRIILEQISPVHVVIDRHSLAFAKYQDLSLNPTSTTIITLTEITLDKLLELYN